MSRVQVCATFTSSVGRGSMKEVKKEGQMESLWVAVSIPNPSPNARASRS